MFVRFFNYMKHVYLFKLILLLSLSIFSCHENPPENQDNKEKTQNNYHSLPDYTWLSNEDNFHEENYLPKFKQYFEQSLEENKFENAAAYLIAYSKTIEELFVYDSVYLKTLIEFYELNETRISKEAQIRLNYYAGMQYYRINEIDKSFHWLKKAVEIDPESDSHKQVQGYSHFSIGQNYIKTKELDLAEKHLVAALNIFEEVGDLTNQGTAYMLLSGLYTENNAYDEAEKILKKAVEILKKDKDDFLTFTAQTLYVHFYIEQGDTLQTIKQIDKLSEFANTYPKITEYHKGLLNQFLAFKFIAQKKEDSAAYHLGIAKEIAKRTNDPDLEMRNLFQSILFTNAFKKPLEDLQKAESFYKELSEDKEENREFMHQLAKALFEYYEEKGIYEKAHPYAVFLIDDAVKQAEDRVRGNLFELEKKFETEKKEKTILLQEKKLSEKNKIILSLAIISVFVVLVFIILIIWTKNKSILKEKKLTENYASQLLQKTENERKRIASDLHDSVSNELVNLRHTIENMDNRLKTKIDSILEEVRNISRNISPTLFDKIGLNLSIEQLIERIQKQHNFFITSEIDYHNGLDNDKELQLYRITQEAITNILKHANAVAGKVSIVESKNSVSLEIRDNGKGFDVSKMLEKGNCFGLLNITERTKYLNGTVNFQSDSSGTLIKILIPK